MLSLSWKMIGFQKEIYIESETEGGVSDLKRHPRRRRRCCCVNIGQRPWEQQLRCPLAPCSSVSRRNLRRGCHVRL